VSTLALALLQLGLMLWEQLPVSLLLGTLEVSH
jgi:hypothetical protein